MKWRDRIVRTPETLFNKPRIAGTRIGVEFLLGLLANGWSIDDVLREYPRLQRADLLAMFAFLRDRVKSMPLAPLSSDRADCDRPKPVEEK